MVVTDEEGMRIFADEMKSRPAEKESNHWFDKSPGELAQIAGFDAEACILGILCLGLTLTALGM